MITLWNRYIIVLLLLFIAPTYQAMVKSFACDHVDSNELTVKMLFNEAFYIEDEELLKFRILANSTITQEIPDVNYTTNMYTTLYVRAEFSGGQIISKYLRFCDYVSEYNSSDFPTLIPVESNDTSTTSTVLSSIATSSSSYASSSTSATASSSATASVTPATSSYPVLIARDDDDDDYDSDSMCPIYADELMEIHYNMSIGKYHKFGSYKIQFSLISSDESQATIGCTSFYVTPKLPEAATKSVAIIACTTAIWMVAVSCFVLIFSPYQESNNPFLLFCSTICNAPLLNQLSPAFDDFAVYCHFAFFTAGLNIQYPGFYQPLVSSIKWIVLLSTFFYTGPGDMVHDDIYETYGSTSLSSLFSLTSSNYVQNAWTNFICFFSIIFLALLVLTFTGTAMLWMFNRHEQDFHGFKSKMFYNSLGLLNRLFFFSFGLPFLTLAIYLCTDLENFSFGSHHAAHHHPGVSDTTTNSGTAWRIAVGVLFFVMWVAIASFFVVKYILIKKYKPKLYSSLKVILIWGGLYHKYEPSRVFYFIIESAEILIISIMVGALRSNGTVQVAIIIVVEFFSLVCLICFKPYYSKTRLNIYKIIIAAAKFVTSVLSIAYIRELNVSEKNRTYVAYAEALLHAIVIICIFVIPSIYCLVVTILSLYRYKKKGMKFDEKEFKVDIPLSRKNSSTSSTTPTSSSLLQEEEEDDGYPYYRAPHRLIRPPIPPASTTQYGNDITRSITNESNSTTNLPLTDERAIPFVGLTTRSLNSSSDNSSNNNKNAATKQVDYSVREVDKFYNASRILEPDPEVRKLWEAREERKLLNAGAATKNPTMMSPVTSSASPVVVSMEQHGNSAGGATSGTSKLTSLFGRKKKFEKKKPIERSFVVERPRQLIPQTMGSSSVSGLGSAGVESGTTIPEEDVEEEEEKF